MKNEFALIVGLVLIVVALFIAMGSTNQDTAPRPQVAQVLATEFHLTPTAAPPPTLTPAPAPTPLRVSDPNPSAQELLAFLFQYPYQSTQVSASDARISTRAVDEQGTHFLLVTGQRLLVDNSPGIFGTFGAVLAWQAGQYQIRFLRVVFTRGYVASSFILRPDATLVLRFEPLRQDVDPDDVEHRSVALPPCQPAPGSGAAPIHPSDSVCY